jgi:minimal PKS acyl carrier protein
VPASTLPTRPELSEMVKTVAGVEIDVEQVQQNPAMTLADLGVDSLGLLGVFSTIERQYGIQIHADIDDCKTFADLEAIIAESAGTCSASTRPRRSSRETGTLSGSG